MKEFVFRPRIGRWKHPYWQTHALGILQGVAEIADGLVTLLSLGFLSSNFEMEVASFRCIYSLELQEKYRKKVTE